MMSCRASTSSSHHPETSSKMRSRPSMLQRRSLLCVFPLITMLPGGSAVAAPALTNKEVDNASSPFVQDLLKRTEEKRDERKKERLNDYYRRNYKDYFSFQAGSGGLSKETRNQIETWLVDNDKSPQQPF